MNEKEFISSRVSKFSANNIKNFPADFISANNKLTPLILPGKTLIIGEKFFGKYEVITPGGNLVCHAENYTYAKFILYSNRNVPEIIMIPENNDEIKKAVQLYENYLDSIIKEIETDYKKQFPEDKNFKLVVNEIFRQLNLVRV